MPRAAPDFDDRPLWRNRLWPTRRPVATALVNLYPSRGADTTELGRSRASPLVASRRREGNEGMVGVVILARHGEPALSRRVTLTAAGYRDWWARYEAGGLKPGQAPPDALVALAGAADAVFSSTRQRSIESARAICRTREFVSDAVFVEAPLPSPPFPAWFRLSPRWWGVVSRFCWRVFDYHDGQESRGEADARARRAAAMLIDRAARGQTVVLIAHGYFNFMIGQVLVGNGWRRTADQGFGYWTMRRFEPPRP